MFSMPVTFVKAEQVDSGTKSFEGEVYYNLESASKICYSVSGLLYSYGNVKVSGGGKIVIGESNTLHFEVTRTGTFYDRVSGNTYYRGA